MKKISLLFIVLLSLPIYREVLAQTSPYQISPKWMFGYGAGFDFGTSPFTNSPPLILIGNPTNNGGGSGVDAVGGMEASSSICDPNSNLLFYTNFFRYYNYPGNAGFNYPGTSPSGSGSSTDGGVIVPDPASPTSQFYIFVANDITGSASGVSKGVNYYKVTLPVNAASVSGPYNLVDASMIDEALCSGSDGNGGYWIVAHGRAASNGTSFLVWHVTSTGVTTVSTQAAPNPGAPFPAPANNNNIGNPTATIKINRCQDRIAYVVGSYVEVYQWDRNTGKIGNVLYRQYGIACCASYGLEFSPDGNYVYFSELNGSLKRVDVVTQTGNPITIATGSANPSCSELGTMQLGPDDKIYVTNCANGTNEEVYVGVINNPNDVSCNYVGKGVRLKPKDTNQYPSISRGIANMAWMTPNKPSIILSSGGGCSKVTHTINFNTYFNSPIDVLTSPASSVKWSFDNGQTWVDGNGSNSITHDYGGSVSTTAMVKFFDKTCSNYEWSASVAVSTNCSTPVCDAPSSSAGADQSLCDVTEVTLNANASGTGIGTWTIISGSGEIESVNDKNSKVKNLLPNSSLKVRWTISKSGCTSTSDDIEIVTTSKPFATIEGGNSTICNSSYELKGNSPETGVVGAWSIAQGTGQLEDVNNPSTKITGMSDGLNRITWSLSNMCGTSSATKEINVGKGNFNLSLMPQVDTVCIGKSIEMSIGTTGDVIMPVTYYWVLSENINDTIKSVNSNIEVNATDSGWLHYNVYAQDFGSCKSNNSGKDSIYVISEQRFVIPNLITPNNDKRNDCLILMDENGYSPLPGSQFYLVNRWGQMVYRNGNYHNESFCAEDLTDGVYYYTLEPSCGTAVKGWLNIISSNPESKE